MEGSWVEQQEKISLFKGGDARKMAIQMLKIAPTNRIVTEVESKLLIALRLANERLGEKWDWLGRAADLVEVYQLTIGEPLNSRQAFGEVLKVELMAEAEERKKRGILGL